MNMATDSHTKSPTLDSQIEAACDRIAPTWPLDQFIAVNPYWGWRGLPAHQAAATLASFAGTKLTMPRSWFREEWEAQRLSEAHIDTAAAALGKPELAAQAINLLHAGKHQSSVEPGRLALFTDVRDCGRAPRPGQTWTEVVTHQISQHCAAHFDRWQGSWHPRNDVGLFTGWRNQLAASHSIDWRHGGSWARTQLATLPEQANAAISMMLDQLFIDEAGRQAYLTSLLLSVNGWAAWCAYNRWQARLLGADNDDIVDLLTIRLAWEWLLRNDMSAGNEPQNALEWAHSWNDSAGLADAIADEQQLDWLLQTAAERTYQDSIISALRPPDGGGSNDTEHGGVEPAVQAVFCIDVRSEVFRRALESVDPKVHTRGFAGFFGLPISYTPAGSALTRPQLPGLLSPAFNVSEVSPGGGAQGANAHQLDAVTVERSSGLAKRDRWNRFRSAPSSVFSFVESLGLLYGPKLVKETLAHAHAPKKWEEEGLSASTTKILRPRLSLVDNDAAASAAIAQKVLTAMGLTQGFAPIVLLCGHGSQTENNPYGAGLDCGACGGQSGEVNARVLADLLNAAAVRIHLRELGISVPDSTWFVPALHNTTTDEVQIFDQLLAPEATQRQLVQLQSWLEKAGERGRAERAQHLALGHLVNQPEQLKQAVLERATDWSQVRPEWGLAGNAAFIVAPRTRTKNIDLGGRSFLHDYDWRADSDLAVLTLIMTAPMVVTNWINLQYHASTVDNRRYGTGNKVLHNVVGGHLGVFEGNGGDLRIGLAMQSLHDGHELRHPPLRLSVFIEAPREAIDSVISQHEVVHDLVTNAWLHLLRIDPTTAVVERRNADGWSPA